MSEPPIEDRDVINEMPLHPPLASDISRDQLQRTGRYLPPPPQMSPPPSLRHGMSTVAPRQRAAIACLNCRKRKVRCCGRDSSESSRCTTCARTNRQCHFVAVRNEAFVAPYALDSAPRQQQSRPLRSPLWKGSYPYPHSRPQIISHEKTWTQPQAKPNEWRTADERFPQLERRDSFQPALPLSQTTSQPKIPSNPFDRPSYSFEHPLAKLPRTPSYYPGPTQDSYVHGSWMGVQSFQGYGQHQSAPPIPVPPPAFLPSVPPLNIVPPGPFPGNYSAPWQHVKMEQPTKAT